MIAPVFFKNDSTTAEDFESEISRILKILYFFTE